MMFVNMMLAGVCGGYGGLNESGLHDLCLVIFLVVGESPSALL